MRRMLHSNRSPLSAAGCASEATGSSVPNTGVGSSTGRVRTLLRPAACDPRRFVFLLRGAGARSWPYLVRSWPFGVRAWPFGVRAWPFGVRSWWWAYGSWRWGVRTWRRRISALVGGVAARAFRTGAPVCALGATPSRHAPLRGVIPSPIVAVAYPLFGLAYALVPRRPFAGAALRRRVHRRASVGTSVCRMVRRPRPRVRTRLTRREPSGTSCAARPPQRVATGVRRGAFPSRWSVPRAWRVPSPPARVVSPTRRGLMPSRSCAVGCAVYRVGSPVAHVRDAV